MLGRAANQDQREFDCVRSAEGSAKGGGIDLREPDGFDELLIAADPIGCRDT